jgi:hypothetical protein
METTSQLQDLNLTTHRGTSSVWDKRGWDGRRELALTRWLIGIGGGALAFEGVRRRGVLGSFFAAIGGTLAWWAVAGDDLCHTRRWVEGMYERTPWHRDDQVNDASADSFPASDAPSWTAVGTELRHRPRTN